MKYKEAFLSKIRSWYASMSIRDKMRIFIEIIAALVIIITLFSFFVFELYRSDFETMLEDNYNTNAVLAAFAIEESAFRDYASVRNDETQQTYNRSYQETTTSIQNLRYNFEEMGLERFWRTRMIRLSYDAYREQCAKVLAMSYEDEEYIKELYFAYTIGNNIISCTKRLIEVTLSESTAIYNSKIVFLETFPVICFIAGSVIILFAFVINSIMVKTEYKKLDIALMDIEMPGINGIEASECIRRLQPDCTIIFITAYGEFSYARQAIRLGIKDYILKPYKSSEIIDSIEKSLLNTQNYIVESQKLVTGSAELIQNNQNLNDRLSVIAKEIEDYVTRNYHRDISLQDAASTMNYSEAYFSKLFKQCFDKNFITYLTEYRIEVAKQLLAKPSVNIKDVGLKVGYGDNNYFTKVFRRIAGINPSDYRASILSKK